MRMKVKGEKRYERFFPHSQIYCNVREFLKTWARRSHSIGTIIRGKKALSTRQITVLSRGTAAVGTVIIVMSVLMC